MGQRVGRQVGLHAKLANHHIVGLALAARHTRMRRIGQRDKLLVQLLLGSRLLLAKRLLLALQFGGTGLGGLSLLLLALLHQAANLLGNPVLLRLHGVGLHLQGAALLVELQNLVDALLHILDILDFQSGDNLLAMIFDILQL